MSMEHPEKQKNAVKSVVDQVMDGIISQIIDGTLHPATSCLPKWNCASSSARAATRCGKL